MEKQYIYILSNSRHEGLLKIGGTDNHPNIRTDQLTRQTGAIGAFQVVWYMVVPNWRLAEQMAFHLLKDYSEQKEYFKVDLLTAIPKIKLKIEQFFESEKPEVFEDESFKLLTVKTRLNALAHKLKNEAEGN